MTSWLLSFSKSTFGKLFLIFVNLICLIAMKLIILVITAKGKTPTLIEDTL